MKHVTNSQFQRYNFVLRMIIILSFTASFIDCLYPFIFPDAEVDIMTDEGIEIIAIENIDIIHIWYMTIILSITPMLWMYSLWQLWGISRIWALGEFLNRDIGLYFTRFSYAIATIFVVESFTDIGVENLLLNWGYVNNIPHLQFVDILFFIDFPFLVACIFLNMGSKAMSEILAVKEEADLTI